MKIFRVKACKAQHSVLRTLCIALFAWSLRPEAPSSALVLDDFDRDVVDQFPLGPQVSAHGGHELAQFASGRWAFEHQAPHPLLQIARAQLGQDDGRDHPFEEGEAFLIPLRGGHQGPQARGALGRVHDRLGLIRIAGGRSGFFPKSQRRGLD